MYSRIVAFLCLFFVSLGLVSARPSPDVVLRQVASATTPTALASPTSITVTNTIQTAIGTMTETCVFTFTPVGQQIQEVRNCTMSTGGSQVSTTLVAPLSTASPTAAAAAFVMPGTSIQVLPVGLGVFGGITAVAVFAVAYVTWERVRYRKVCRGPKLNVESFNHSVVKLFRQRRMAENNSIQYGGVTKG
ncbi:hypothetical protein J3R83DRAFT_3594 [Lanmaoa asiatica]|nr:hypothetical protein J3R83DRAFT_3594 [Lanmaoa asiatica]